MKGAGVNQGVVSAVGWGLVYLALAGVIGWELDWVWRIQPSLPVQKPAPAARVDYAIQPEFTLPPLEQRFVETTARPVFAPTRLPPPPPAPPAPPKPAMQKGQFVLLGALITKGKSVALLRDVATGKAIRVEQGKEIKGITVANVLPEKVTLTQYDDSEEVVLKIQSSLKAPASPNATSPAAGQPQPAASMPQTDNRAQINARRISQGLPPI